MYVRFSVGSPIERSPLESTYCTFVIFSFLALSSPLGLLLQLYSRLLEAQSFEPNSSFIHLLESPGKFWRCKIWWTGPYLIHQWCAPLIWMHPCLLSWSTFVRCAELEPEAIIYVLLPLILRRGRNWVEMPLCVTLGAWIPADSFWYAKRAEDDAQPSV